MPNPAELAAPPRNYSVGAAFLSYLIPGLGQIYQGRVGKGLLFLGCLYALFFGGMYMGNWKNVYIPDTTVNGRNQTRTPRLIANLYNRLQFVGQFWIGVAAWPAIWQYNSDNPVGRLGSFDREPSETEINELQRDSDKTWDLGWVYTVIAGVLNILVIYDAFAGPAFVEPLAARRPEREAAA
jgi:hypothetical protein